MMTVHKRPKELHEKMPDLILREPARLFARALGVTGGSPDKGGQVSAAAILHDHVEDTLVAVDVAVVVAHYVLVVQVLEDVHLRYNLPPVPLGHEREGEVLPSEDLIQQIRRQGTSRKQGVERASMQTKASGRRRIAQRERQTSAPRQGARDSTYRAVGLSPNLPDDAEGTVPNHVQALELVEPGGRRRRCHCTESDG
jgi:hypothetical protein